MLSFSNKTKYEEFVRTIGNGMRSDTFEFYSGFVHERGFYYLVACQNKEMQEKIMEVLKTVDKDLNFAKEKDGMYRKLTYFLKAGIFFGEHTDYAELLSPKAIATFLTETYLAMDETDSKYITLLADNDMLLYLRDNYANPEKVLLAMEQHYDNNPFDVENKDKAKEFRANEIERLKADEKEFFSDVKTIDQLYYEAIQEKERVCKK